MISRRGLLLGLGASLAAPAVVKYAWIMPVRSLRPSWSADVGLIGDGGSIAYVGVYFGPHDMAEIRRCIRTTFYETLVPRSALAEMGLEHASPSEIANQVRSGTGRLATLLRAHDRFAEAGKNDRARLD